MANVGTNEGTRKKVIRKEGTFPVHLKRSSQNVASWMICKIHEEMKKAVGPHHPGLFLPV